MIIDLNMFYFATGCIMISLAIQFALLVLVILIGRKLILYSNSLYAQQNQSNTNPINTNPSNQTTPPQAGGIKPEETITPEQFLNIEPIAFGKEN